MHSDSEQINKKLSVLSIAYPFAPVRSDTAGGAEQVLRLLDEGLVRLGHESTVLACSGSRIVGNLIDFPRTNDLIECDTRNKTYRLVRDLVRDVLRERNLDLIHLHGIDFMEYLPDTDIPVLITLHLPVSWYDANAFKQIQERVYFNCVSRHQEETAQFIPNLLPFVENGVPIQDCTFPVPEEYVVVLGRICPEKGIHLALDAARQAGTSLILAGKLFDYETHHEYYLREVLPRLDGNRYQYVGSLGLEEKNALLGSAKCLLAPSLAPETSSLVTMEAYACGTPVVAFPSGALSDLVEHGKTGFLVNSVSEMAQAIARTNTINRKCCRDLAEKKFSANRMVADYVRRYRHMLVN
ncbi:glycosyltransferase family 4 protein [Desulfomonile tiedjei]|nr:glycosyltransferase family 4 protein [Desulfomonile tiedjei]